jgi:hypothetical protein
MSEITIPPAALEAGAKAIAESLRTARLTLESEDGYKPEAGACFIAIIEAWEGAKTVRDDGRRQTYVLPALILPLPTENSDE